MPSAHDNKASASSADGAAAAGRQRRRIAVVGSGIAGLSSAYILARNGVEVTLFEKDERCGGHTLTDTTANPPVDLGFMVFNYKNYPHLTGFFNELRVDSEESDMSFAVSVDEGRIEWASHGLSTVFCQWKNLVSPQFWTMIRDVLRFSRQAQTILRQTASGESAPQSVGEYLKANGYSKAFLNHYLLPMSAAIWSAPNSEVMKFPIATLVKFFSNHCMLDPFGERPCWRVLKRRGQSYVKEVVRFVRNSGGAVRTNTAIAGFKACPGGSVSLLDSEGNEHGFDSVVFACHPDQTLRILKDGATEEERDILSKIRYQSNAVYLHSDAAMMPREQKAWASWNVLHGSKADLDAQSAKDTESVFVTYWLNRLQNLPEGSGHRFCTLNPARAPGKVIRKLTLAHPLLTGPAVAAQKRLSSIQGTRGAFFCGAWCAYGFHEDGIKSAVRVCVDAMGLRLPWTPRPLVPTMTFLQRHCLRTFDLFATAAIKRGSLRLILPSGRERFYGGGIAGDGPAVTLFVKNMDFFVKVVRSADIGLGEAWMAHDFEMVALLKEGRRTKDAGGRRLRRQHIVREREEIEKHEDGESVEEKKGEPEEEEEEEGEGKTGCLSVKDELDAATVQRSDQLTKLVELAIVNNQDERMWKQMRGGSILTTIGSVASWAYHRTRANTLQGSRDNIAASYDLSNELFEVLLAPSWMYSCAMYRTGREPIEEAQRLKLDTIIAKAGLSSGHHVLEIGCGWGEFAIRAARTTGCRVTGVTISSEQLALAKKRVREAGVSHLVSIVEMDYRHIVPPEGGFDAIVSIEMLEAVGQEYLQEYHETVNRLLKEGGKAVIQVITTPEWRYESYKNRISSDFIARYIFPGSHLPSVSACEKAARDTSLVLIDKEDIGPSYAPTLRDWRIRLMRNQEKIKDLKQKGSEDRFDDRFVRMYEFYFAYCEAAFKTRYIGDYHLVWQKDLGAKRRLLLDAKRQEASSRRQWAGIARMMGVAAVVTIASIKLVSKALRK